MGNGFKVWHYSGALLHETPWPAGQELLQVIWQKYDENVFKEKPISNVKVQGIEPSQPQSSTTKYVPIHLRGGASSVTLGSSPKSAYQPERGPIPGLPVGYKVSQGQRKKERNNTKRKDSEGSTKPGANTNTSTNSNANEESGGRPARAPQNTSTSTTANNKPRNNQRTPKPSNNQNQNHSIGNGANANNQSQNNGSDSNAKAIPNNDSNVSGSAANDQSNTDSDEARKAKRDGGRQRRQRKSESGSGTSGDPEKDKRIRTVQQKLKDISKLKVRRENGENLEANQLSKIKMEAELVKELSALKVES